MAQSCQKLTALEQHLCLALVPRAGQFRRPEGLQQLGSARQPVGLPFSLCHRPGNISEQQQAAGREHRVAELFGARERLTHRQRRMVRVIRPQARTGCDEPQLRRTLWLGVERKKPLPKKPPTIEWAMKAVARLGGWIDTQRTGRPGWENLGRGWRTLEERVEGVEAAMRMVAAGEM